MSGLANSGYPMGAFERTKAQYQVDFGIRKAFAGKKENVKLLFSDAFDLNRFWKELYHQT